MARIICGGLIGLALLSCSPAFAQPPEWSRGLRELSVSKDECLRRAAAAFRKEGLQIDVQDQTFVIGTTKYSHTAAVGCFPMGESRTWVTILVASNGGWGHQVNDGLMREITMPGEPPSVGGTLFDDPEPPPPNPDIPQPAAARRGTIHPRVSIAGRHVSVFSTPVRQMAATMAGSPAPTNTPTVRACALRPSTRG